MRIFSKLSIALIGFCVFLPLALFATNDEVATPAITSISPSSVQPGDIVYINGTGFTNSNTIYFNNCPANIEGCYSYYLQYINSSNGTSMSFQMPGTLKRSATGAEADVKDVTTPTGVFNVSVSNTNGTSNSVSLTITAASTTPAITSVSPASGGIGDTITVYGTGFSPTNNTVTLKEVIEGGTPAVHDFSGLSSSNGTSLTFTLTNPFNSFRAVTHTLYVTNDNGRVSNQISFIVTNVPAIPHINLISPSSAKVGDTITITGTGFAETNTIYFNNCPANIEGCYPYYLENIGSSNSTTISFVLPTTMKRSSTGAAADVKDVTTPTGSMKVSITNINGYSNSVNFTITSRTTPLISVIRTSDDPNVYLIVNNQKILIPSWNAFVNAGLNASDIQVVTQSEINAKPSASLLKSQDDPRVYVIEGRRKLWIPSATAFTDLGYKWENIVSLPATQINIYSTIDLAKTADSDKVYLLANSQRRWITTAEKFVASGYNWENVAIISGQALNVYALGSDIK